MAAEGAYSAQLEAKLKSFSLSPNAAHWVAKAMHPVWGAPSTIPDAVQVDSINPEYKNTLVLSCPTSINTANWDAYILLPPSDTTAAIVAYGPTGTNFATATYAPGGTTGIVASSQVLTVPLVSTLNFNAMEVTTSTTAPAWAAAGPFQSAFSAEQPACWRTTARSATLYSSGSDLYNQGTVYAGQYARVPRHQPLGTTVNLTGTFMNYAAVSLEDVDLPLDENTMELMTPSIYTAPVREGVYTVHRLTGPSQDFVAGAIISGWDVLGTTTTCLALPPRLALNAPYTFGSQFRIANTLNLGYAPWPQGLPATANSQVQSFSTNFDSRCTWGVIILRGMHPLQTLTLKTVVNVEFMPTDASPSRQFTKPSLKYEPTAMAAYYALAGEAPTCMAAKHNLFGTLIPMLTNIASKVLPFLAPIAGRALGSLAPLAGQGISHMADRLTKAYEPSRVTEAVVERVAPRRASSVRSVRSRASSARSVRVKSAKRRVKIARRKR